MVEKMKAISSCSTSLARLLDRLRRRIAVVVGDEVDLAPVDAAPSRSASGNRRSPTCRASRRLTPARNRAWSGRIFDLGLVDPARLFGAGRQKATRQAGEGGGWARAAAAERKAKHIVPPGRPSVAACRRIRSCQRFAVRPARKTAFQGIERVAPHCAARYDGSVAAVHVEAALKAPSGSNRRKAVTSARRGPGCRRQPARRCARGWPPLAMTRPGDLVDAVRPRPSFPP